VQGVSTISLPPLPSPPQVSVQILPSVSQIGQKVTNNQVVTLDSSKALREKKEEDEKGKEVGDGEGGARERTEDSKHLDGRHTHESDDGSDEEEKAPRARLRPSHVPGSLGLAPPSESALGKKLALGATPAPLLSQADRRKGGPKGMAQRPRGALGQEVKRARAFFVPLMDLCRVDVPLLQRIPNSQRSHFATAWGRRLQEAVDTKQVRVFCVSKVHLVISSKRGKSAFEEGEHGRLGQRKAGEVVEG
jgi:hypothetical protein